MIALEQRKKKRKLSAPRELDRYPLNLKVDFRNCGIDTLKNYITHYNLKAPENSTHAALAAIVAKHFNSDLEASEEEIVPNFVNYVLEYNGGNVATTTTTQKQRSRKVVTTVTLAPKENGGVAKPSRAVFCICQTGSYGEMIACDGPKCKIEWFHVGCVGIKNHAELKGAKWYCPECSSSRSNGQSSGGRKGDSSPTYCGMITDALNAIPERKGSFKEICEQIEALYKSKLNWKFESELRKTPVWKSSVRKILISSPKFKKLEQGSSMYTLVQTSSGKGRGKDK